MKFLTGVIVLNTTRNKIAGAVYGFMIGDAMGASTEFMDKEEIVATYGKLTDIVGGGWLNIKAGDVTDDTEMTMCVMSALMKYHDDAAKFKEECANNFEKWLSGNPKDVGNQCRRGIKYFMYTGSYIGVENDALGNGSLMRAMPCAILGLDEFNVEQGAITHNNETCTKAILQYSKEIKKALLDLYSYTPKSHMKPTGHVHNTLQNALYWSSFGTFEQAIIGAVNDGGDADTIAAITGGIVGARFGVNKIPKNWIDKLDSDKKIFAEKFINFAKNYLQQKDFMI